MIMAKELPIDLELIKGKHPDNFNTPEGIAQLGCDYCNGEGVKQNYEIGRTLLEKAAEMGCVYAMTALGSECRRFESVRAPKQENKGNFRESQ